MYDYATWNMYDRIVSARRMRLAGAVAAKKHGAVGAAPVSRERGHGKERCEVQTEAAAGPSGAASADAAKNAKATSAAADGSSSVAELGSDTSSATSITFESDYYDCSTASSSASASTSAASSFVMAEAVHLRGTTTIPEGDHEDHFIFHMEM